MESLMAIVENIGRYLSLIRVADVVDVAIIAFLVYKVLGLVSSTRAENILKGIVMFLLVLWLSTALELRAVSYIMTHVAELGILALIVLFQPEIRQLLEKLGSRNLRGIFKTLQPKQIQGQMEKAIEQTVAACSEMSKAKTGALMVFEREISLNEMLRSGTSFDAEVNSELVKNIFFINAPMHDGAMIVRNGRIVGAGCMLPLSKNVNLSRELGMRHRAGIGMSENSDAVVVIVSEETGSISVAVGGMLKRHLMPETLGKLLRNELLPPEEPEKKPHGLLLSLRELLQHGEKEDAHGKE